MGNTPSQSKTKRASQSKPKGYKSGDVTERYIEKLKRDVAANKALQDAIKTGENPGNTSPIFDDSSDDEEYEKDEQTPVTTISKKGSIQSAEDPEGNIHIGDNKLGGKRRKKHVKEGKRRKRKREVEEEKLAKRERQKEKEKGNDNL